MAWKEDAIVKTLITLILLLFIGIQTAGAWDNLRGTIFIEGFNAPDEIEHYDSIEYVTGKSERHFRLAWMRLYNEEMYIDQCINALKDQAILVGANSVLNLSWNLEREYPDNWYTVVCQGLAAWKY